MATSLVLPDWVRAKYEEQDRLASQTATIEYIDRALKARDRDLSLKFVYPDVEEWDLPVGAVPGYWHVRVDRSDFVPVYIPIKGAKGELVMPTLGLVYDILARSDLTKPEVFRANVEAEARRKAREAKETVLRDEQGRDEMVSDFKAAKRVAGEGGLQKKKWGKK